MSDVTDYLAKKFPAPCYLKTSKYEVGVVLFTANPYLRTNATIIEELIPNLMFKVLTDIGNALNVSVDDLKLYYLPPVCKRSGTDSDKLSDHFLLSDYIKNFSYNLSS